jgi:hypothetical protein
VEILPLETGNSGVAEVLKLMQEMTIKQDALALELEVVKQSMPAMATLPSITPSGMSENSTMFGTLITSLGLDAAVFVSLNTIEYSSPRLDFEFDFNWSAGDREAVAYDSLVKSLVASGFIAVAVGNGTRLRKDKLLFDANLFSLRQVVRADAPRQSVFFKCHVRGATDIVVLYDNLVGETILAHNVKFAIEIKKDLSAAAKRAAGLREAITELLGLCALNSRATPPVLLTDLKACHFVVRMTVDGERYKTVVEECDSLKEALQRAVFVSELPCCTDKFARPVIFGRID